MSCATTPRSVPPPTKPGAPVPVPETIITCEEMNGATPTTPGSVAMRARSAVKSRPPKSAPSTVTWGLNDNRRSRKSSWNPLITESTTVSAKVPIVTPTNEITAISETKR